MLTKQKMHRYAEDNHDTGVVAYSIGKDAITILFQEGWYYLYDKDKPGAQHVKNMKELARQGRGLSGYISQHRDVWENFKRKWRED
jgi:hypothetical protein